MGRCLQHSTIRANPCSRPVPTPARQPAPSASPRGPIKRQSNSAQLVCLRNSTFSCYGKEPVKEWASRPGKLRFRQNCMSNRLASGACRQGAKGLLAPLHHDALVPDAETEAPAACRCPRSQRFHRGTACSECAHSGQRGRDGVPAAPSGRRARGRYRRRPVRRGRTSRSSLIDGGTLGRAPQCRSAPRPSAVRV